MELTGVNAYLQVDVYRRQNPESESGTTIMAPLLVLGFLTYCFWRLVKRLTAPKSPLTVIPGPKMDHWLTGSSPSESSFRSTDHFLSSGNYHQLFRDAFRYNLALVEEYGGAVKINALLGVIPQISAKSEVAHTSSAEPTALHIRPSRSASHTRQRTAHLYRNRHVHHVRSTLYLHLSNIATRATGEIV
jgi:hypothetical protein